MTNVTSTPPALRWVALFLAACAVLGLFLGFRDQIRKNPPGWYTGAEQIAVPLVSAPDGAREAVPFDPDAPATTAASPSATTPAPKRRDTQPEAPADKATTDGATPPGAPAARSIAPPVLTPAPAPRLKAMPPPARTAPPADPVGDILEGQKQPDAPAAVPY